MRLALMSVACVLCTLWGVNGTILPPQEEWRPDMYDGWMDGDMVHIHVVAHSHDDTGWLRTVDNYYEYEVSYILDTVVQCLLANPERKFIEVEIAFFERWWNDQDDDLKEDVRKLVKNKQLEFVQGGWCMHDEAVTNYVSQINQLTEGHTFLLREFGPDAVPSIAWHIDPFGASNMSPGLFAEAGYEAFVINRLDYRLKEEMKQDQELEFIWRGSQSQGESVEMFAHVLDSHYNTPTGFDWEHGVSQSLPEGDGPPVVVTNPPSHVTRVNVADRARQFVAMSRHRNTWYRTNHMLIPFGSDFNFQNALMKYKNMDKLIKYINEHSEELNATATYSTLTDYFEAVHAEQLKWKVRTNDFFPYADDSTSYWTGFYTSRPNVKQTSRETDATLRSSDALLAMSNACLGFDEQQPSGKPAASPSRGSDRRTTISIVPFEEAAAIAAGSQCPSSSASYNRTEMFVQQQYLRRAAAVSQHHDAVTGTERQHVAEDYLHRLDYGFAQASVTYERAMARLFGSGSDGDLNFSNSVQYFDDLIKGGVPVLVPVFNPLEFTRTDVVVLPIGTAQVVVTDASGDAVPFEVAETMQYGASLPYELFVRVTVPPLGYTSVVVTPTQQATRSATKLRRWVRPESTKAGAQKLVAEAVTLANEYTRVAFDASGQMTSLQNLGQQVNASLVQSAMYYTPSNDSQTSGAYIFRPDASIAVKQLALVEMSTSTGPLVQQVRQVMNESGVAVVTRLFLGLDQELGSAVRQSMHVGPIDVNLTSLVGKEYITRFSSDIASGHYFYTDNNGMEMQERVRNLYGRPGDSDLGVALAGNYYPIVSRAYIKAESGLSTDPQFSVVTAHSHGGSSLDAGQLELMVHRRLLRDDGRGVGQALNDTSEVTVRMGLLLNTQAKAAREHRKMANVVQYPLIPFYAVLPKGGLAKYAHTFAPLTQDLPENVRIISLKPLRADVDTVILRLMNIFQSGEDEELSQEVTVDLGTLFAGFSVSGVEERTLTGLMEASKNVRPKWISEEGTSGTVRPPKALSAFSVTLKPMQIRTFWLTLAEE